MFSKTPVINVAGFFYFTDESPEIPFPDLKNLVGMFPFTVFITAVLYFPSSLFPG